MGVCNCSMFCCTLLYVHSSFAIILLGKRELVALFSLSSWCLVVVVCLFLAVPWVCLQFVVVVFPGHTHLLFLVYTEHCRTLTRVSNGILIGLTDNGKIWVKYFNNLLFFCRKLYMKTVTEKCSGGA